MRDDFLEAMSRAVSSVAIVSASGADGPVGITVSAMVPVTADPPVLLVCINQSSQMAANLSTGMPVVINLLRAAHHELSDVFARRTPTAGDDKFQSGRWTYAESAPRLEDALAAFPGRVRSLELVGTHFVALIDVEAVHIGEAGPSLLYANRSYGTAQIVWPAPRDPRMAPPSS